MGDREDQNVTAFLAIDEPIRKPLDKHPARVLTKRRARARILADALLGIDHRVNKGMAQAHAPTLIPARGSAKFRPRRGVVADSHRNRDLLLGVQRVEVSPQLGVHLLSRNARDHAVLELSIASLRLGGPRRVHVALIRCGDDIRVDRVQAGEKELGESGPLANRKVEQVGLDGIRLQFHGRYRAGGQRKVTM